MKVHSTEVKEDLQRRLRRIEGQVRGIQRMVDEERDCRDIIQQLNAVHAAVQNASRLFVRAYAKDCLLIPDGGSEHRPADLVDELLDLMNMVR